MRIPLCSLAAIVLPMAVLAQDTLGDTGYRVEVVADGLEHPWSVAFLPDNRLLVTERPGRLRVIGADGRVSDPVEGLPTVFVSGQGGLFEALPARDFASSGRIFVSFAHGVDDANHTRVVSARLVGSRLVDVTPIFTSEPSKSGDAHFGGRMLELPDGTLMLGLGDGFFFRETAQKLDTHMAKTIRINADGSVPQDNPFVGHADALPEIYSYGHRHVQALVWDEARRSVLAHEHGPRGGDELNRIQSGRNYGWPVITYGLDYSRALISPFTERQDMEQPLTYWVPSIAPGGMMLYQGRLFPQWRGSLFVAALAEKSVRRVPLDAQGTPAAPEDQQVLFTELDQRMRDVRAAPDGSIYLVTDEAEGQVLRIVPATSATAHIDADADVATALAATATDQEPRQ